MCTLVEVFPTHHRLRSDFEASLQCAWLYAKAVTLLSTGWCATDSIIERNRRVGCSLSGVADFVAARGRGTAESWFDAGYRHLRRYDSEISGWLEVPRSIKLTSVKPSGTVSLLAGVSPGAHFPVGGSGRPFIRRIQLSPDDPLVAILEEAGYQLVGHQGVASGNVIAEFAVAGSETPAEAMTPLTEKTDLARLMQRVWADNQVSVTLTFNQSEADRIGDRFDELTAGLKSAAFLPLPEDLPDSVQPPFEELPVERFMARRSAQDRVSLAPLYQSGYDPLLSGFCDNDSCDLSNVLLGEGRD